ncbi:MAG: AI-2E family transporter [bacterium]
MDHQSTQRPFLKVAILVLLLSLAVWLASYFPELVFILITSTVLSFVLKPFVKLFEFRFGLRRGISVLAVFVIIGSGVFLLWFQFFPLLVNRFNDIYLQFKSYPFEAKLAEAAQNLVSGFPLINPNDVARQIHDLMQSAANQFGSIIERFLSFAASFALIPVVTYFLLADGDETLKSFIERVPNKYFEMTLNVLYKIRKDLVSYVRGWLLEATLVGFISVCGYFLIGVQYALLIGIVAGFANLIPYLGPVVGAIPAVLVSITQYGDARMVVPIIIVAISVQLIDEVLIQPLCFSKAIDVHPLTVIIVLLIGNELLGIVGMVLAIPLFTVFKVTAKETYWGLKNYRITN